MNPIRAIIVDDETGARNTLKGMLGEFCPQVDIVGAADNIEEAIQLVNQTKPDLVFLDVQMSPYESGFDLIGRTSQLQYGVIFQTAYSQYAIRAINSVQPWAYLVKPFSADDLMEAVRVAAKRILEKSKPKTEPAEDFRGITVVDARKGQIVIRLQEILYCRTDQSVVEIYYIRNEHIEKALTYQSLKQLMSDLPENQFCRTHHGFMVNMAYIDRFEKQGRTGIVHLKYHVQAPVSVQKMDDFERQFKDFLKQG